MRNVAETDNVGPWSACGEQRGESNISPKVEPICISEVVVYLKG